MAKSPAFQFYPGDWLRDSVAGCSLCAQGLWLRMMILAHDCEEYGVLAVDGKPMASETIARRCGCSLKEYQKHLAELDSCGVPRRREDGAIYSKRMVSDGKIRSARASGGGLGADHGHKGGRPQKTPSDTPSSNGEGVSENEQRGRRRGFKNNPPSSSSSSSPSGGEPPNPPSGSSAMTPEPLEIPASLDTPEFREAFDSWVSHRKQKKKPATAEAKRLAIRKLAGWGPARAIEAIQHSVSNGWDGIFEPDHPRSGAMFPTKAQRSEDEFVDFVTDAFPEFKQ